MADVTEVRNLVRKLFLMNIANGVIDITDETVSNLDYLYKVLTQEIELREEKRKAENLLRAKLPKIEFDHSTIPPGLEWQLERLKEIDYRETHQNSIIVGECLTGKTELASEL